MQKMVTIYGKTSIYMEGVKSQREGRSRSEIKEITGACESMISEKDG